MWIYFPQRLLASALEGADLPSVSSELCDDSAARLFRCAMWRSKRTQPQFWQREWRKEGSPLRRFGRTLGLSSTALDATWRASLTCWKRDTRASRSQPQDGGREAMTLGTFGRRYAESSVQSDLFGVSSRTSAVTCPSDSMRWRQTFTHWVTWLSREYSQRRKLARLTGGRGCSSSQGWLTPKVATGAYSYAGGDPTKVYQNLEGEATTWPTPTKGEAEGGKHKRSGNPYDRTLQDEVRNWPTPKNEAKGGKRHRADRGRILTEEAQNWPFPRGEDSESAGNHPGAVDSLTGATRQWQTPDAAGAYSRRQGATAEDRAGKPYELMLRGQAEQWQTPQRDSFRTRGGDRKDEEGLDRQARGWTNCLLGRAAPRFHQAPETPKPGPTSSNGGRGSLPLWKSNATDGGWATPTSQTGGDGPRPTGVRTLLCNQVKEGKKRLNPAFVCWMMGWPDFWSIAQTSSD